MARSSNPAGLRSRALRVLGSADAVMAQQSSDEVRVLGRDQVAAGAAPAARLGITGHAVLIRRLRLDGGEPVSYAENYLRPEHAARISDADLAAAPVTKILRDALALPLTRIDNEVSACTAPAELAALLRVDVSQPGLAIGKCDLCGGWDASGRRPDPLPWRPLHIRDLTGHSLTLTTFTEHTLPYCVFSGWRRPATGGGRARHAHHRPGTGVR